MKNEEIKMVSGYYLCFSVVTALRIPDTPPLSTVVSLYGDANAMDAIWINNFVISEL